ncbi:hypothetical protein TruAng_012303 [Truncatella angustata]|nr:hypothetical protein TruAng_012303 [Truncatella angustata]
MSPLRALSQDVRPEASAEYTQSSSVRINGNSVGQKCSYEDCRRSVTEGGHVCITPGRLGQPASSDSRHSTHNNGVPTLSEFQAITGHCFSDSLATGAGQVMSTFTSQQWHHPQNSSVGYVNPQKPTDKPGKQLSAKRVARKGVQAQRKSSITSAANHFNARPPNSFSNITALPHGEQRAQVERAHNLQLTNDGRGGSPFNPIGLNATQDEGGNFLLRPNISSNAHHRNAAIQDNNKKVNVDARASPSRVGGVFKTVSSVNDVQRLGREDTHLGVQNQSLKTILNDEQSPVENSAKHYLQQTTHGQLRVSRNPSPSSFPSTNPTHLQQHSFGQKDIRGSPFELPVIHRSHCQGTMVPQNLTPPVKYVGVTRKSHDHDYSVNQNHGLGKARDDSADRSISTTAIPSDDDPGTNKAPWLRTGQATQNRQFPQSNKCARVQSDVPGSPASGAGTYGSTSVQDLGLPRQQVAHGKSDTPIVISDSDDELPAASELDRRAKGGTKPTSHESVSQEIRRLLSPSEFSIPNAKVKRTTPTKYSEVLSARNFASSLPEQKQHKSRVSILLGSSAPTKKQPEVASDCPHFESSPDQSSASVDQDYTASLTPHPQPAFTMGLNNDAPSSTHPAIPLDKPLHEHTKDDLHSSAQSNTNSSAQTLCNGWPHKASMHQVEPASNEVRRCQKNGFRLKRYDKSRSNHIQGYAFEVFNIEGFNPQSETSEDSSHLLQSHINSTANQAYRPGSQIYGQTADLTSSMSSKSWGSWAYINPLTHWTFDQSPEWYENKMKEVAARGSRKSKLRYSKPQQGFQFLQMYEDKDEDDQEHAQLSQSEGHMNKKQKEDVALPDFVRHNSDWVQALQIMDAMTAESSAKPAQYKRKASKAFSGDGND